MNSAPSAPSPENSYCARASVPISAPVNKVWETLLDFPSYPEWYRTPSRSQVLVDADGKPLPSQTPIEGARIAQEIHLPALASSSVSSEPLPKPSIVHSVEVLTHVDFRSHTLAWPSATRLDREKATDFWRGTSRANSQGEETVYETWEVLGGALAPAVSWLVLARLKRGLEETARALKARLEKPAGWTWG
ncbi:hypothetical protein PENSPDRAFT_638896 [Peniophora sp. CONT]|nr:hypothetical protein PENSPDRAFT_638896 [Peniophora sp. CONT]